MKEKTKKIFQKFFKYKIREILAIPVLIFLPYYTGKLFPISWVAGLTDDTSKYAIWGTGIVFWLVLTIWIWFNWKLAEEYVEEENDKSKGKHRPK